MHAAEYIRIPLCRRDGTIRAHAIIDAEDEHLAVHHQWLNNNGYAVRHLLGSGSRRPAELLHRAILGLVSGDGLQGDHIDGDRLNCRRSNLRIVTHAQNGQNRPSKAGASSRHRGVAWETRDRKWRAQVMLGGVNHYLGSFDDENEAAAVVRAWRLANMPFAVEDARPLAPAPATM